MADRNSDGARHWMGVFALEGDNKEMVSGELKFHPREGITVRTLDWVGDHHWPRNADRRYSALKGLIEGTRKCTVLHAFEAYVGGGRLEQSRIVGNAIVLDGFCEDLATPTYRRMHFRSSAFTAIANPRGIKVKHVRTRRRLKVDAEPLKAIKGKWGARKLTLSSVLNAPGQQAWDGTFNMTERPYLKIQFGEPVCVDEIYRLVAALEFFSCVGDGAFSGPPEVSLWTDVTSKTRRSRAAFKYDPSPPNSC